MKVDFGVAIEAAKVYELSAKIHREVDSPVFAAQQLLQAAGLYRTTDPQNAIRCFREAAQIFAESGNWSSGAKAYQQLGLVQEIELKDYRAAIESFETAGKWYELANMKK